MFKTYPAIIHDDADGCWIEFPDLEGCQTCGDSLEETLQLAEEALGLYIASLLDNGQALPAASKISSFDLSDGYAAYVSTEIDAYRRDTRAVKKMISVPAWLAKEAEQRNISLSKLLQEALKDRLHMA